MAKVWTAIFAIAMAACGVDNNATDTARLDDLRSSNDPMDRDPTDPTPEDPQPEDPQPCDPPTEPPSRNECEQRGAICLPLDPNGMYPPCPDGLVELPIGCPFDEANQLASACCGFAEEPYPEPPVEDPCSWAGGVCWGADENGNVVCPEGLEPRYDLPCAGEEMTRSVCCAFSENPPTPPGEECPDRNDPWVSYVGDSPEVCDAIEFLCADPSAAFRSPCGCGCFIRPDQPPPPPEEGRCPDPNDPDVIYVSEDLGVCSAISYTCPSNHVVFTSDCGCGCLAY